MVAPSPASPAGIVVWERQIDPDVARNRMTKLRNWYGIPTAIALAIALIAGGPWAFLGVLILLGGIGLLLLVLVVGSNKALTANPEIRLVDGRLVLGKTSVAVAQVESWTTDKIQNVSDVPGPDAIAMFRLPVYRDGQRGVRPDGGAAFETVRFGWNQMTEADIDGVRRAIEPHIAAPWVPLDRLSD